MRKACCHFAKEGWETNYCSTCMYMLIIDLCALIGNGSAVSLQGLGESREEGIALSACP